MIDKAELREKIRKSLPIWSTSLEWTAETHKIADRVMEIIEPLLSPDGRISDTTCEACLYRELRKQCIMLRIDPDALLRKPGQKI